MVTKKKNLRPKTKSSISQWLYLFPQCSLLWVSDMTSKQKVLIYTTQRQTLFHYFEKQNN